MKRAAADEDAHLYSADQVKEDLYRRFSKRGLRRQRLRRLIRGLTWIAVVQAVSSAKRAVDFLLGLAFLILLAPGFVIAAVLVQTGTLELQRTPRLGRWCERFSEYGFTPTKPAARRVFAKLRLGRLPVLLNILKGDMSFVGPRAAAPGELSPQERKVRRRYNVRPGLICLWWLRRRANIDYGSEIDADREYVETQSLWRDFGITMRAVPAILYGEGLATGAEIISVLGIKLDNLTMTDTVEAIVAQLDQSGSQQVCFVNAQCANLAYRNPDYARTLSRSWLTLADGIGMKLAGKFLAREIRQNVNGTDLFPRLCEALSGSGKGIFLLGARPGIADAARGWIEANYPKVTVSGAMHGYFSEADEEEVVRSIADSGAAVLLVALGAPRQDLWIGRRLDQTGVRVALGVGGLFDFYSGRIPRAPQWLREMGGEWLFRFYQEPRRMWQRYFVGNAIFLLRVARERIKGPR